MAGSYSLEIGIWTMPRLIVAVAASLLACFDGFEASRRQFAFGVAVQHQ